MGGYYRTDLTEHSERGEEVMESFSLSPSRFHSFEDDTKEIGIGGTCSSYSEEINSYSLSVKLSHVFSNPATRSARNKLVFSLVQTHQTLTSADGILH